MTKNFRKLTLFCALAGFIGSAQATVATVITFDDAIDGETSHLFDADSDGNADVIFSTVDPFGFSTSGPGPDQIHVQEPGLEGGTEFTPDLRVDFLQGAIGSVGFGFATTSPITGVFQVFDESHAQIGSQAFAGAYFNLDTGEEVEDPFGDGGIDEEFVDGVGVSVFPENRVDLPFGGVAAYALIDFNSGEFGGDRFIIDNFTIGELGDTPVDLFAGADPMFPILPDPFDPENPEFAFELEILEDGLGTLFPIFIDPIIAIGYEYEVDSGPNVATVLIPAALPNGDADFLIEIAGVQYAITAGVSFDIFAETGIVGGVSSFKILDISTAEALDPTDDLAFNTGLTFVSAGTANVTQTPITFDTDPPTTQVPLPATLILLLTGLAGVGVSRRSQWLK
ncbi:MAG: VPLPA-CTERM sorting domain-containing protein [Motiliproteus sp.]|nr:VPLPA-CTERM sorting domain-containing protein [Motiliproteus sp.]